MLPQVFRILIVLACALVCIVVADNKNLCYSGSSMYQLVTQDCTSQDRQYEGTWYCAKVEVCESYMSNARQCITSRGCAKEEQCTYTSSSGANKTMNNYPVKDSDGQKPAGMKITTTCCKAAKFPTDDTVAIDYADICNAASSSRALYLSSVSVAMIAAVGLLVA